MRVAALVAVCLAQPAAGGDLTVPDVFPFGEFEVGLDLVGFNRADIVSVDRFRLDNLYAVQLRLDSRLDGDFVAATRGKIGYFAVLRLCGQTVTKPMIQKEMTGATFVITAHDPETSRAIADLLIHPPCSES